MNGLPASTQYHLDCDVAIESIGSSGKLLVQLDESPARTIEFSSDLKIRVSVSTVVAAGTFELDALVRLSVDVNLVTDRWVIRANNIQIHDGDFGASDVISTMRLVSNSCKAQVDNIRVYNTSVPGVETGSFVHSIPADRFQDLAFPASASDPAIEVMLDEMGDYDGQSWRFGHWNTNSAQYREPGTSLPLSTIEIGEGYWLWSRNGATITTSGTFHSGLVFEHDLGGPSGNVGWHQLGNPYPHPIYVGGLRVGTQPGQPGERLIDASNSITERSVAIWNNNGSGGYQMRTQASAIIPPGASYWVRSLNEGSARVFVPNQAPLVETSTLTTGKPDGAEWAVRVAVDQESRGSAELLLGSAAVHPGGWNSFCMSQPPAPPEPTLGIHVLESEWGESSGDYVHDFRAPGEATGWNMTITGIWPEVPVRLTFDAFDLPAGMDLRVFDPLVGGTTEVESGSELRIAAPTATRMLRLDVVDRDRPIEDVGNPRSLVRIAPNPSTAAVQMALRSRRGDRIAVEILEASGRRVWSRDSTDGFEGTTPVVWDGRDDQGRSVGPGVYFVRYRVGADTGGSRIVRL